MNGLTLVFVALCVFAVGYRYYGLFVATRVLRLDVDRSPPSVRLADGHDYVQTNKYILFGHHFAAIAAAGPLLGPVLAAQFGYLPGALWILFGAVLGGAVHDMVVLFASVRHNGQSLAKVAETEIGKGTGRVASFAILFILVLTLAGLSLAVVNALFSSVWGTWTVLTTIPIAIVMGLYLHRWRPNDTLGASIIGVVSLLVAVLTGPQVADSAFFKAWLSLSKHELALLIPAYGFAAAALPVWLLLCPRDYLSTYLKLGTIALLAVGLVFIHPTLQMPALTPFVHGGGPVISGSAFPFVFITIACGAISGFHAIIGTGTTPKMIDNERNILFVGYGAMLAEGFVAMMALIAACVLVPADYFAINSPPAAFEKLGMAPVHLDVLARAVGENVRGRPGGAVSLAIGMSYIFSSIPFMSHLTAYWYHFVIMFEAVFILTAVDTGTRVGRFFLQEMLGHIIPKFNEKRWVPGIIITSLAFTVTWGYLVYTGDIGTIWPLFGMANQLLASSGLIIATTMIIRLNRLQYAPVTALPGLFLAVVTFVAGYENIVHNYLPKGLYLLVTFAVVILALMLIVFLGAFSRWYSLIKTRRQTVTDGHGEVVLDVVAD